MSELLSAQRPVSDSSQSYYHGFDISSDQFPTEALPPNMEFSVHDILQPFPEEHIGRYDLVNVRLLVGAIKEADYFRAVNNAAALLSTSSSSLS